MGAAQCPSISEDWDDADGVPIDAIIFGGRRATNVPLVSEAQDWGHGVFFGATISSEQTAAAEGPVGELRLDPFAMLPFCGYNMADHWSHWLEMGETLGDKAPRIFRVNWFRKSPQGRFLWPGFGDNVRVLEWIDARLAGEADAVDTPIGALPRLEDIDTSGLDLDDETLRQIFAIDPASWLAEAERLWAHLGRFGDRVPSRLVELLDELEESLRTA